MKGTQRLLRGMIWVWLVFLTGVGSPAQGQTPLALDGVYEVSARADALDGNFEKARRVAVRRAMGQAVEEALKEILGEPDYLTYQSSVSGLLSKAKRYVRSYRFIDATDNLDEQTSDVLMEVTVYSDALRKGLGTMGILSGQMKERAVTILIKEKNLSSFEFTPFWDTLPLTESLMLETFQLEGIDVVPRNALRNKIPEETVMDAVRGEIPAAVDIGVMAGANMVIVGTAVSTLMGNASDMQKTVQVSVSLKAVSASMSRIVAAKSEFATARRVQIQEAEQEAFAQAIRKLSDFFMTSIRNFWDPGAVATSEKPSAPAAPAPVTEEPAPPMGMEDL